MSNDAITEVYFRKLRSRNAGDRFEAIAKLAAWPWNADAIVGARINTAARRLGLWSGPGRELVRKAWHRQGGTWRADRYIEWWARFERTPGYLAYVEFCRRQEQKARAANDDLGARIDKIKGRDDAADKGNRRPGPGGPRKWARRDGRGLPRDE